MRPSFKISMAICKSSDNANEMQERIYLVTFSFTTDNVLCWYSEIVKVQRTGRGGSDAKLLFLLCDLDAHIPSRNKTCDSLVPFTGIHLILLNSLRLVVVLQLTLANMRKISASQELVIHILEPLITQWSPSFFARVCSAKASEPDPGSERQKQLS